MKEGDSDTKEALAAEAKRIMQEHKAEEETDEDLESDESPQKDKEDLSVVAILLC